MSAKKKTAPKKKTAAKKAAKVMAEVMDSIIDTVEPVSIPSHEVFEEDDYNEFAPSAAPKGWMATQKEAELDREAQDIIIPPDEPQPVHVEAPSVPEEKPKPTVKASSVVAMGTVVNARKTEERVAAPPVATSQTPDINELEGDALIVQRLINGINHLYGIARLTKGPRGPQPEALVRIQSNILAAKELIARLS